MRLISPWVLIRGWESFQKLHDTHPEEFCRLIRQSQHFITPDGERFAPVRLLRELGQGRSFPVEEKDSMPFGRLEPDLQSQGWIVHREGVSGFNASFAAWERYCLSFGPENGPKNWKGGDPRTDRTFTVPA